MTLDFDVKMISDRARDALLADPYFSSIVFPGMPVPWILSEDPQNVYNAIQKALSDVNLAVVILLPMLRNTHLNEHGPYFDDCQIHIKIYELPIINRPSGHASGYQILSNVCRVLHEYAMDDIDGMFFVTEATPIADPDFLVYQVGLRFSTGFQFSGTPIVKQIAPVVAYPTTPSVSPQIVTLTCVTPGAAIYYTLDGSYPSPLNPTSMLYLPYQPLLNENGNQLLAENGFPLWSNYSTLSITPGQILRARSWLAGYAPTNPAELYVHY